MRPKNGAPKTMQIFGSAKIMEKASVLMEGSVSGAKRGILGSKNKTAKMGKTNPILMALIKTRKHKEKRTMHEMLDQTPFFAYQKVIEELLMVKHSNFCYRVS